MFHAAELHQMVRSGAVHRDKHKATKLRCLRGADEVEVSFIVDRSWTRTAWPEARQGRDHSIHAAEGGHKRPRVPHVPGHVLGHVPQPLAGAIGVARQDPHMYPASAQSWAQLLAEMSRPTGHEDLHRTTCCRRASLTVASPVSTGSR